jgi:DNA-binding NtrC family response regulator
MAGRSHTILFVDDDRQIADAVREVLCQAGYLALSASDAESALRIIAARPVDMLITDIVMPGGNGVDLAQEAKRLNPGIKVIFLTGYAQRAAESGALHLGRIVYKPARGPEILQNVRSLLVA